MRRKPDRTRRDPTISLINIVFLILIFVMVSSTLSQPAQSSIAFIQTTGLECCAGGYVLEVDETGALYINGQPLADPIQYMDGLPPTDSTVRILPDQNLPARDLLRLVQRLKTLGASNVTIITENSEA